MFLLANLDRRLAKACQHSANLDLVEIVDFLRPVQNEYPSVLEWFNGQVLLSSGERRVFAYQVQGEIVALGIGKNTVSEKKICTLRVAPDFQHKGLGSRLITEMCDWLGTSSPLITVSESKVSEFQPLLKKFNFMKTDVKEGVYKPGVHEFYYNEIISRIS